MNERSAVGGVVIVLAALGGAAWSCGSSGDGNGSSSSSSGSSSSGGSSGSSGSSSGTGGSSGSSSGTGGSSGSSGGSGGSSGSSSGSGGTDAGVDAGFDAGASVLMVGHDVEHRMTYTEPTLTQSAVTTMAPFTTFNTNAKTASAVGNTTGQGLPSVLYLESGPAQAGCPTGATGCKATTRAAGAGYFLLATALGSNPNVYAFDETTGLPTWTAYASNGGSGGGDGIRGTPAIDPVSRRVFLVTGNNPHVVHALSLDTGVEVTTGGWPVTLSTSTVSYLDAGFNSGNQNQRGALLLVNDILYIPFGGEDGDGGNYKGWVVAIDTTNPASIGAWSTLSPQSGIWASGGLASDGTYVYAETGNSTNVIRPSTTPMSAWDSEEVVRLSGLAKPTRDGTSVFVAHEWQTWDEGDLDFGSSSPAVALLPAGSNPSSLVLAPGKAGVVYLLNGSNLSNGTWPGDAGGEVQEIAIANTSKQAIYSAPTVYSTGSGLHSAVAASVGPFALCPSATQNVAGAIISMSIQPGGSPPASVAWCAENAAGTGKNWYPPISTTTDGVSSNPIVWFLTGGATAGTLQLTGVNGDTGAALVTTSGDACASVPSLSFPIVVHGRVVVAGIGHLCAWSLNGQ